jgi:hypothetical protein
MTWLASDVVAWLSSTSTLQWLDLQTNQRKSISLPKSSIASHIEADPAGEHFAVLSSSALLIYHSLGRCLQEIPLSPPQSGNQLPTVFWLRSSVTWLPAGTKGLCILHGDKLDIFWYGGRDYRLQFTLAMPAELALCKTLGERTLLFVLSLGKLHMLQLFPDPTLRHLHAKTLASASVKAPVGHLGWDRMHNRLVVVERVAWTAYDTTLMAVQTMDLSARGEIVACHPFGGIVVRQGSAYTHMEFSNGHAHDIGIDSWIPYGVAHVSLSSHGNALIVCRDNALCELHVLNQQSLDPMILAKSLLVKHSISPGLGLEVLLPVRYYFGQSLANLQTFIKSLMTVASADRLSLLGLARILAQLARCVHPSSSTATSSDHVTGSEGDLVDYCNFAEGAAFFEILASLDLFGQRMATKCASVLPVMDRILQGEVDVRTVVVGELRRQLTGANFDADRLLALGQLCMENLALPRMQALLVLASFRKRLAMLLVAATALRFDSWSAAPLDIAVAVQFILQVHRDLQSSLYASLGQEGLSLIAIEAIFVGQHAAIGQFFEGRAVPFNLVTRRPEIRQLLGLYACRWCRSEFHALPSSQSENPLVREDAPISVDLGTCYCGCQVVPSLS